MPMIPDETREKVLAATDIADLIGSYIEVKRNGSAYVALCPFHSERTPSFNINPVRQFYHCFGCGASGDAIKFIRDYENLPYSEAVKRLADRAGIPVIEEVYDPASERKRKHIARLKELHNALARYLNELLMKSPDCRHARDYMRGRGFGGEMAQRWLVGWMPDNAQVIFKWAKEKKFSGRELVDAGICALKNDRNPNAGLYLRFRNRLMFPIHNDYGDIIAFSGRQLIEDPNSGKYINSSQTLVFDKSRVVFGLDKAKRPIMKAKFALLCEGQIDAISCSEQGIENAIAPLGTAFTPQHAKLIGRYTKEVVLCYDSDAAGFKAADRAFAHLTAEKIAVRVVSMPPKQDPDSYIKEFGIEAFRQLLDDAKEFFEFKFAHEFKNSSLNTIQEKAELARKLADLAAHVGDKLTKDALVLQIATRLGLGAEELRNDVVRAEKKHKREHSYTLAREKKEAAQEEKVQATQLDRSVATLCQLALCHSEAQEWMCEQVESLYEALQQSYGGAILLKILSQRPNCDNPAAVQTFISKLAEGDQMAVRPMLSDPPAENPVLAAEQASSMLISSHLQKKEAALRARMADPAVQADPQLLLSMMQEAKDLKEMLGNMTNRAIR
ncbi:DNA primase [Persicirhabdus sediminis]|uniref:DNA primase n=1 Tax=Persicirhabdus sediminis TaxID=454144 RepID=A0A8J7SNF1_9BACT|nr:DNA primase [Persicirhabdus sediminis]MBK1791643.1 DNA primase [Persicirhabdus sediminis]